MMMVKRRGKGFRITVWRLGGRFRKLRSGIVVRGVVLDEEIVNLQFRKTWKGSSLYIH